MRVEDSLFAHNRTEQQGGALWVDGQGDLQLRNSLFVGNVATRDLGGAFVYNGRAGELDVQSCGFAHNEAGRLCGAFFWASRETPVGVRNTYFVENHAEDLVARHVRMPWPVDVGGNLEWTTERPERGRVFERGRFADPELGELTPIGCRLGLEVPAGSPLAGAGVAGGPSEDAAGRERASPPTIGPFEVER